MGSDNGKRYQSSSRRVPSRPSREPERNKRTPILDEVSMESGSSHDDIVDQRTERRRGGDSASYSSSQSSVRVNSVLLNKAMSTKREKKMKKEKKAGGMKLSMLVLLAIMAYIVFYAVGNFTLDEIIAIVTGNELPQEEDTQEATQDEPDEPPATTENPDAALMALASGSGGSLWDGLLTASDGANSTQIDETSSLALLSSSLETSNSTGDAFDANNTTVDYTNSTGSSNETESSATTAIEDTSDNANATTIDAILSNSTDAVNETSTADQVTPEFAQAEGSTNVVGIAQGSVMGMQQQPQETPEQQPQQQQVAAADQVKGYQTNSGSELFEYDPNEVQQQINIKQQAVEEDAENGSEAGNLRGSNNIQSTDQITDGSQPMLRGSVQGEQQQGGMVVQNGDVQQHQMDPNAMMQNGDMMMQNGDGSVQLGVLNGMGMQSAVDSANQVGMQQNANGLMMQQNEDSSMLQGGIQNANGMTMQQNGMQIGGNSMMMQQNGDSPQQVGEQNANGMIMQQDAMQGGGMQQDGSVMMMQQDAMQGGVMQQGGDTMMMQQDGDPSQQGSDQYSNGMMMQQTDVQGGAMEQSNGGITMQQQQNIMPGVVQQQDSSGMMLQQGVDTSQQGSDQNSNSMMQQNGTQDSNGMMMQPNGMQGGMQQDGNNMLMQQNDIQGGTQQDGNIMMVQQNGMQGGMPQNANSMMMQQNGMQDGMQQGGNVMMMQQNDMQSGMQQGSNNMMMQNGMGDGNQLSMNGVAQPDTGGMGGNMIQQGPNNMMNNMQMSNGGMVQQGGGNQQMQMAPMAQGRRRLQDVKEHPSSSYEELSPAQLAEYVANHPLYRNLVNFDEDLPFQPTSQVPYFWHIHKSGGSSMKHMLTSLHLTQTRRGSSPACDDASPEIHVCPLVWGRAVNADASSPQGIERIKRLGLVDMNIENLVVTTSRVYEALNVFNQQHRGRLFVLLREPIERAVSKYYYTQIATWERNYHPEIANLTLVEYAQSHHCFDNWMTRRLLHKMNPEEALTEGDLNLAKEILRQKAMILLMEDYPKSVHRLTQYFGWKVDGMQRWWIDKYTYQKPVNKNPHPIPDRLSPEWTALRAKHIMDIELYRYAMALYHEKQAGFIYEKFGPVILPDPIDPHLDDQATPDEQDLKP